MKKFSLLFFCQLFVLAAIVMSAQGDEKITICHFPPDNPENPQTITVKSSSLPSHLAHCDSIGDCTAACTNDGDLCGCDSACCSINCSEGKCAPASCKSDGVRCDTPSFSSTECCSQICSEEGICASDCVHLSENGEGGNGCSVDKPCCPGAGVCVVEDCFLPADIPTCGLLGDTCNESNENYCCFDYICNGTPGQCVEP